MKALFRVNNYDRDGDIVERCITISLGNASLQFKDLDELKDFNQHISNMIEEIEDNYLWEGSE